MSVIFSASGHTGTDNAVQHMSDSITLRHGVASGTAKGDFNYTRIATCGTGGLITWQASGSSPFEGAVGVGHAGPATYSVSVALSARVTARYRGWRSSDCAPESSTTETSMVFGVVTGTAAGNATVDAALRGSTTLTAGHGCVGAEPRPQFASFPETCTVTITWHLTRPDCDAELLAKALRELATSSDFALAGVKELEDGAERLREFRDDYIKESLEIGAEKASALQILKTASHTAAEVAEVTAFYVGLGVTIEELAFKIGPALYDEYKSEQEAKADFARAWKWYQRGARDLRRALKQGPCLGPLEQKLDTALAEQKAEEDVHALVDSWQAGQAVYRDPVSGDLLDEAAALRRARALVSSRSRRAAQKRYATVRQIRAAIRQLDLAQAVHAGVKEEVRSYQKLIERSAARIRAALR